MDTATLRILDTISSNIGNSLSINQLTERIKAAYGIAYYTNIYKKIQDLSNEGLLMIEQMGRSSNINLNFQNYLLIDSLSEMEIEKKRNFLTKRNDLIHVMKDIDEKTTETCSIKSISAINAAKNLKLNRLELLFLTTDTSLDEIRKIIESMLKIQNKFNLRIDCLIIQKKDFMEFLSSDELNPLKESIGEKIIIYLPQNFWSQIKETAEKTKIKAVRNETKPSQILESDLIFNLRRFGYSEFGRSLVQGQKICLEYIVTTLLVQDDIRLQEAIPVILMKNSFKSAVLAFLSQKFGTTRKLLGILKTLHDITPKKEIDQTINLLNAFKIEAVPEDKETILQKLRLYNAL